MKLAIILISWLLHLKICLSLKVTPSSNPNPQKVKVELNDDPRGINKVVNNRWKLDQDNTNGGILFDWGLVATFDAEEYGFKSGSSDSRLIVSLDGECGPQNECDGYFAFSIGGNEYVIFTVDFDGAYLALLQPTSGPKGMFGVPACGAFNVLSGDVSSLMSAAKGTYANQRIRDGLANGDNSNWYLINDGNNMNGKTFPVTFELINDDVGGTFTVQFSSATTSFSCSYTSAVSTGQEIKMYFSPDDVSDEVIYVKSIEVLSLDECGYEYVSDAKSYEEAEAHCLSTYGTHLAEIQTRQDRDCAIYKTGDGQAPWNGIHSDHKEEWFEYFDENTLCPLAFSGACVHFWVNGVPQDCETGHKCTVFYDDLDAINNDKHCDSARAFLCNDEAAGCLSPGSSDYSGNYVIAIDNAGVIVEASAALSNSGSTDVWLNANNYCKSRYGTSLATVLTAAEAAAIGPLVDAADNSGHGWNAFMVGLNDREEEGTFVWADGTCCARQDGSGLCTSLWSGTDPNGGAAEDCVYLFFVGSLDGLKIDYICSYGLGTPVVCNDPLDGTDNGHQTIA